MAGENGYRPRDEAGLDMTIEQLSHPSQPFRRKATSSHLSPAHPVRIADAKIDKSLGVDLEGVN